MAKQKEETMWIDANGKTVYKGHRMYGSQIWTTRPDGSLDIGEINEEPSRTDPQFADECDINNIMKKYTETGTISHRNPRVGVYGDFSQIKDFRESVQMVMDAQKVFDDLPADVRRRFDNDPAKLIDFCGDKNNLDEAIKLGLAPQKVMDNANNDLNENAKSQLKKGPKPSEADV